MLSNAVLYCTVLYSTVLSCVVMSCTVLCTVLCCGVPCIVLYCTVCTILQQFWWLQHTTAPHSHPRTPPPTFGWPWTSARPWAVKIFERYVCVPLLKICTTLFKFFGLTFKIWTAGTEKI